MKSLDAKLARIRAGQYSSKDFIIADAKDGDMGFGRMAPGPGRDGRGLKTKAEYFAAMTEMTKSGLVDIMLTSLSTAEALAAAKLYDKSPVTSAVRLNDTTDIWSQRGSSYKASASRPFRSARLAQVEPVADLGLYSVTFSNDIERDLATLEAYGQFRDELAGHKIRHFLEVFNAAFDIKLQGATMGEYVNDCIVRALAGVGTSDFPLFLKMQYNGAKAMEELAAYDPTRLVAGILGGARGTTRDTFELAAQAEKHGARVALFGRKINFSESPLDLVKLLLAVVERELKAADAVKAYHDILGKKKLKADRELSADIAITDPVLEA
jgi:DhnA family fructose-bisphosphate aldolase class Ia